jgi:hypothetical protein
MSAGPRRSLSERLRAQFARLHRDENGNVLVLAVAASLLLVAMVWAIVGTGQRLVQKETIQSSADAAAFSAAVIKAKGLNLIAFCNLVMALLFAIVLLLRVLKYALSAAAFALAVLCAVPFTAAIACGPAATVANIAAQFNNWEPRAEDLIKQAMNGLSQTERAVAKITPVLSLVEAYHVGTDAAYKKNFSKGTLVTVSYPLPTTGLPVEDSTCQKLASHAGAAYGMVLGEVLETILGRGNTGGKVGSAVGDAFGSVFGDVAGLMCGGSGTITTQVPSTDCNQCRSKGHASIWAGQRVLPNGTVETHQCAMNSMPAWSCGGVNTALVSCDQDPDAQYRNLTFVSCEIDQQQQSTTTDDWPKALELSKDWTPTYAGRYVRAFTVLSDSNLDARRRAVGIAARNKPAAPALNQLVGMAQAEMFGFNGHEDLWHMDWRARLVRFRFSDGSDTSGGVGDAAGSGVPAGAVDVVSGALGKALGGAGGLQDQFLLH